MYRYYRLTILILEIILAMIKSFKCEQTEGLFKGEFAKKLPSDVQRIAQR